MQNAAVLMQSVCIPIYNAGALIQIEHHDKEHQLHP